MGPSPSDEALEAPAGSAPRFLSAGWFEALDAALRTSPQRSEGAQQLLLGQVVTGAASAGVGPSAALVGDEVRYKLVVGALDGPAVVLGSVDGAEVTLVTDYASAAAVAAGRSDVKDLIAEGRLKVRGDARALVAAQDSLAALAAALGRLASKTVGD